jgi:hypothetical protein
MDGKACRCRERNGDMTRKFGLEVVVLCHNVRAVLTGRLRCEDQHT